MHSACLCAILKEKGCWYDLPIQPKRVAENAQLGTAGKIRDILAANGIEYRVRTRSNTGGLSRSRTVLPGTQMKLMYQYYIYVKRTDYEKAKFLIK